MNPRTYFSQIIMRFRYPVTLPEEIAVDLGISIPHLITFEEFMTQLSSPYCNPSRLKRYMSREDAEKVFGAAQKQERFLNNTLCSYYFTEGWVEFVLYFDNSNKLRRVYVQHHSIPSEKGIEIKLNSESY